CDVLLTSLSTSRFVMQVPSSVNSLLYFISSETHEGSSRQAVLDVVWLFFNLVSLSSATWLSIFYCVKVTNFANHVFLWLKLRINMLAPRLLGLSIIISSIFSIPSMTEYIGYAKCNNPIGTPPGCANQSVVYNRNTFFLPLHVTFASINFSISTIACTILLNSLWNHIRNLKKSGVGDRDLNSQVHINVIKPLLFYVFFYLLYFSSVTIISTGALKYESTIALVFEILVTTFPSAHSIILIFTNTKLKEIAARILNIRQRAL
ncbi:taste receptor type 2 member 8-like, partial [Sceloporus undulatus]|uniref:taste receptor type 2 member 8-like n=1 Tax=Sceloporus undulatus TaxID=8520 RepID=UPI001C4BF8B4